jgi:hypothetical protein
LGDEFSNWGTALLVYWADIEMKGRITRRCLGSYFIHNSGIILNVRKETGKRKRTKEGIFNAS